MPSDVIVQTSMFRGRNTCGILRDTLIQAEGRQVNRLAVSSFIIDALTVKTHSQQL